MQAFQDAINQKLSSFETQTRALASNVQVLELNMGGISQGQETLASRTRDLEYSQQTSTDRMLEAFQRLENFITQQPTAFAQASSSTAGSRVVEMDTEPEGSPPSGGGGAQAAPNWLRSSAKEKRRSQVSPYGTPPGTPPSASGTGYPPKQFGSPAIEVGRVAAVAAEFEKGVSEKGEGTQKRTPDWGEDDQGLDSAAPSPARPNMPALPALPLDLTNPTVLQAEEAFSASLVDLTAAGLIVHNLDDDIKKTL